MGLQAVVGGFRGAVPLPGLPDAWYWSPVRGIEFAAALSADGQRLLHSAAPKYIASIASSCPTRRRSSG
ncbi:hypothetical protein [Streptomyces phaeochromogenes]|uniref:hypothetical protein n=1 Tax=Streptomyces phaeochromogenes TaxID=1923 RepID=UPI0037135B12